MLHAPEKYEIYHVHLMERTLKNPFIPGTIQYNIRLAEDVSNYLYDKYVQARKAKMHHDDWAVEHFAEDMKQKLAAARDKGRQGWNNPRICPAPYLAELLVGHLFKANPDNYLDVANFCMMLHERQEDPVHLRNAILAKFEEMTKGVTDEPQPTGI